MPNRFSGRRRRMSLDFETSADMRNPQQRRTNHVENIRFP